MNNERITKVAVGDLEKRRAGKTDWSRLDAQSDEDIEQAMRSDADWADVVDFDWSKAQVIALPGKKMISIRLDEDVLAFFKAGGAGYQKRINAVLRSYMHHARKERA